MRIARGTSRPTVRGLSRLAAAVLLALVAGVTVVPSTLGLPQAQRQDSQTRRDAWMSEDDVERLPPELRQALEHDPFTFFRRVNRVWTERVCTAFADEHLPQARLHGDAHVEQYALTRDAYGLDDFDDSAEGPPVIDLVRFIGSLHLAARQRSWQARVDRPIEAFLDGYRRALAQPSYVPPTPRVVRRLRAKPVPAPAAFLASVEARMEPVPEPVIPAARKALETVSAQYAGLPTGYFTLKKIGALQMGVGSYTASKFLMRVEGPSLAPDDDLVLEAKEVSDLNGVKCIRTPAGQQGVRVILGTQQIGRLHHSVLSVFQGLAAERATPREWSLRSWDRTYVEVHLTDLRSVEELEELARDAGAQLGSTSIGEGPSASTAAARERALDTVVRLQARVRRIAADLTREMLAEWRRRSQMANGKR